jgi:iron complex transport system ATP-binding protein
LISVHDLSVVIDGSPILHGVNLVAEAGSWTSLIGPNGAGKTTLLRAVAGLLPCTGEVLVCGVKPQVLPRRKLARMLAYVPQNPLFPYEMLVKDYVLLGRTPYIPYLGTESAGDLQVVAEVLEQVGLDRHAWRRLGSLSGGELQRAVLARALAQEARVILLDEPTTGMDLGHQQQVLELVDSLRAEQGLTVLSAIHDLTLAGQFSERLLMLDEGRTCAYGSPREVLTESMVLEHYGAPVRVVDNPLGGIAVVALRGNGQPPNGEVSSAGPTGAVVRRRHGIEP